MTHRYLCLAQALLRAKALECISLVGMAVGRDRFRADAHEVMKFMQALQQQELDPDDPTGGYMLQVLAVTLSMSQLTSMESEACRCLPHTAVTSASTLETVQL